MSVIWKDGAFLDGTNPHVFHNDSGFTNGLGVFDSMMAKNGVLLDAKAHFERLIHDADIVLGIGPAWIPSFAALSEAWLPLLSNNRLNKGYARIKTIVTGGLSDKPLGVSEIPSIVMMASQSVAPESLPPIRCALIKNHPRIARYSLENSKRLDYTRSLAARREAVSLGAEDAIITNTDGHVACGTTSNLFIEENGVLTTPPLQDGVLAGITRANILRNKNAQENHISEDRLRKANKIFLTNSFWGMREVILLD